MIRRNAVLTFIVLVFYPIFIVGVTPEIFRTPFDSETISRFIIPFHFHENANIPWAIMESAQWDIFRPVYSLSVLSDYVLWGTNARMYHVSDLILSWACYILVFLLLKRQFGFLTAAIAVCLWTVHPAQPMSLLKVFGRNDRLVTLFTVAALSTYDVSIRANTHRKLLFCLTLLFVVLATLSKDTGIFYSLLLLPAWSILARKRPIREIVTSDRLLWLSLFLLAVLFAVMRHLAGFSISIDSEGLNLGLRYFQGLSALILTGIPLISTLNLNPVAVCVISITAAGTIVFCRKCPGATRFGTFAFCVFIFPFPFFWIQGTFLWGFCLWISLALAGCATYIFDKYIRHRGNTYKLLSISILVLIFSLSALWSSGVTGHISTPMIKMHEITIFAISSEEGPVYSEENILTKFPGWAQNMENCTFEEDSKIYTYITELIQVETGNPESVIERVAEITCNP